MKWLQNNIIQILIILASITFGYANFTSKIESTAQAQIVLRNEFTEYKKETSEKLDKLIRITERIDERTKRR